MSQSVEVVDRDAPGFTLEACGECGTPANTFHYPGCSGAPYVCPGCFAFNGEPCATFCPDAAIARALESSETDEYERDDLNDSDDWETEP